jgi:hypothetical protein
MNRLILPAPGDYDDGETGGMMIGRGNRSTRRKKIAPVPLCPQTPTCCSDANPARRGGKPPTNRFSYGTVFRLFVPISLPDRKGITIVFTKSKYFFFSRKEYLEHEPICYAFKNLRFYKRSRPQNTDAA